MKLILKRNKEEEFWKRKKNIQRKKIKKVKNKSLKKLERKKNQRKKVRMNGRQKKGIKLKEKYYDTDKREEGKKNKIDEWKRKTHVKEEKKEANNW